MFRPPVHAQTPPIHVVSTARQVPKIRRLQRLALIDHIRPRKDLQRQSPDSSLLLGAVVIEELVDRFRGTEGEDIVRVDDEVGFGVDLAARAQQSQEIVGVGTKVQLSGSFVQGVMVAAQGVLVD
ncbi:hypothetical protein HBH70_135260 [Parastagonospora nodorum]|nr:hypothetical protein HBH92_174070 [Parastagonospora nodorum]KAH4448098.1 hypothetical protein HBH93_050920 [Parastagonospora nodorum]KAH4460384.1 hypothetical protein HBH91_070040 [Parastagonospora nodorum]KAH4497059.1 hypothetical protein HBH89_138210 [Parastagonospora nodorum]KAH4535418.1 hypothetical protein HBH85_161560 [Parastagonospora nodorum]